MELREERVFLFKFTTDAGDVQFPVRAQTKDEAADIMQKMLSRIQTEIAMEFPKVMNVGDKPLQVEDTKAFLGLQKGVGIPPEVLELRIDTLLADMGVGQLKGKAKDETIKLWTGYDNTVENYTHIITELELLKTGQKELPIKKNAK